MNTKFLFIVLDIFFLIAPPLKAKDIIVTTNQVKVIVAVGTTASFTGVAFRINIKAALPDSVTIDRAYFAGHRNELPKVEIRDAGNQTGYELDRSLMAAALFFVEMVEDKPDVVEAFSNQTNFICIDTPLKIKLTNGDFVVIAPDVLKEASLSKANVSESNKRLLIAARGGDQTFYQNKINIGMRGDTDDSSKTIFTGDFSWSFTPLNNLPWWKVAANGYFSSTNNDPFSEISIFPLMVGQTYGLESDSPISSGEVRVCIGIEGNQSFKKTRLNGSIYYTTLLPNLIDLTNGSPNRLRLFPVIKLGLEYWDELDDTSNPDALYKGGKAGGELYYYIPVLRSLCVLMEGNFGYVFGSKFKEKNKSNDFAALFNFTLGYEIPGSDMKALVTYSTGENDINFINDNRIILGVAIDFLQSITGLTK